MASEVTVSSTPDLVGWTSGPETRGTLTLVWSCVITIFACTWTVLHLNVPGRDEGPLTIVLRKIKWMTINIIFPEFIFAKAVCDLRLALEELREFDENVRENQTILGKWTSSEGWNTHEWSWEFEYPLWAHTLYQLLQLKPPPKGVKQEQPPLWILKALPLAFASSKSESQSDTEAQRPPYSEEPRESSSQTLSSISSFSSDSEVTSIRHNPHVTSSTEHEEASRVQTSEEALTVRFRTVQKWTVVHSYYAQMGGILYQSWTPSRDSPPQYYCCTASMLTARYSLFGYDRERIKNLFRNVILGTRDIGDKSKADWVLKGIAVAQVSWLILSVIVRSILDLPITQLEIATISFAVMAVLSYAANWWKPKDISYPTLLQTPLRSVYIIQGCKDHAQSFMLRLLSPTKVKQSTERIDGESQRVRNDVVWMETNMPLLFTLMAISSLGFGGLHCLAWNFKFPSQAELLCWRVATVVSAGLPALTLGISLVLHFLVTSFTDFALVSSLSRKLEPLNGLQSDFWKYMKEPNWDTFYRDAQSFLIRNPVGLRDWEKQPFEPKLDETHIHRPDWYLYHRCKNVQGHLADFVNKWEEVRRLTPYAARTSRDAWFRMGSATQAYMKAQVLDLWHGYEGFIKSEHGFNIPDLPDRSYIAFMLQAYDETEKEVPRWEKIERNCDRASLILTIVSGVVYTISRLTILVLLFTCLRETPAGVYQVTPWLNLLPNFS
ncbi:hypothetical protein CcaCcLH18_05648 [Colletotrichum camelliae]|nr:hypothetical protein CcaCcLH18_05648 [Colletotrichum camelliae]